MKDSTMLLAALAVGCIGLASLYILSLNAEERSGLEELYLREEGERISMSGEVVDFNQYGETAVIKLKVVQEVEVAAFGKMLLEQGSHIEVKGDIGEYGGRRQIVAERIEVKG